MSKNLIFGLGIVLVGLIGAGLWWGRNFIDLNSPPALKNGEKVVLTESPIATDSAESVDYQVEQVAINLEVPWSISFVDRETMIVTERPGRIRKIINGQVSEPLITFSEVSNQSEEGLMGMVLDPNYDANQLFYVCLAYPKNGELVDKVVRLIDEGETARVDQIILDDIPSARNHAGCRLIFGPDGKLYVSTGDATEGEIAQNLDSLGGKILRINSDGSIPDDNPVAGSLVFSYGHRNPQGLAWHPLTQELFSTEHGPSGFDGPGGGDEVNWIQAGENYGWPIVSHDESQAGMVDPLITFTPAVAPASAMFYSGVVFPQFANDLFFGGLRGQGIFRVRVNQQPPFEVIEYEKLDGIDLGRIRAVTEGPDGLIYFSTSNRDGRGNPSQTDDAIYRLSPR